MQLIPDRPLSGSKTKKVEFAYSEFAKSTASLIDQSPRPFTIGLFGKWGTGKSTIIRNLRLAVDKRKYIFVTFDVWKYESDALRRSFLIDISQQINSQLSIITPKIDIPKLERKLYNTESRTEEELKPSLRLLFAAAVLGVATFLLTENEIATLFPFLFALLFEIVRKFDPAMFVREVVVQQNPADSPEQFEQIFRKTILGKVGNKTLIVVIDNLDRTQREKTVELLSTVKTFLNTDDSEDNVIFVIACDDKAIKEHIKNTYVLNNNGSEFNPSEFLQKFFNVSVELPVLIENEVISFTQDMLSHLDVDELTDNRLRFIINYAYEENPREIKQYINNLAAYYHLLTDNSSTNGLTAEFINQNLYFICKMLVIRDKYPEIFKDIKEYTISALPWSEIKNKIHTDHYSSTATFKAFDIKTEWAEPSDEYIFWFFRLRRSDEEMDLPGWDQFRNFASVQNFEEAESIFNNFQNLTFLDREMKVYINRIRTEPSRITPLFATYLKLLLSTTEENRKILQESIELLFQSTPDSQNLATIVGSINLNETISTFESLIQKRTLSHFIKTFKEVLEDAKLVDGNIAEEHLLLVIDGLKAHKTKLKTLITPTYQVVLNKHPSLSVLKSLRNESTLKEQIIKNDVLQKYIDNLNPKAADAIEEWEVLADYSLPGNFDAFVLKTVGLLQELQSNGDAAAQHTAVDMLYNVLKNQELSALNLPSDRISNLVTLSQFINDWFSTFDEEGKSSIVLLLALLFPIPGNTANDFSIVRLREFITSYSLESVLGVLKNNSIDVIRHEAQEALRNRMATNNQEIISLLPYLDLQHIIYVISHVTQKAIDSPTDSGVVEQMTIANQLYQSLDDETAKQSVSDYVVTALSRRANDFPHAVKSLVNRNKYKYISAAQKKTVLSEITEE